MIARTADFSGSDRRVAQQEAVERRERRNHEGWHGVSPERRSGEPGAFSGFGICAFAAGLSDGTWRADVVAIRLKECPYEIAEVRDQGGACIRGSTLCTLTYHVGRITQSAPKVFAVSHGPAPYSNKCP